MTASRRQRRWASIHIAGGFAPGKVADTDKAALMAQLDGNLVSCFPVLPRGGDAMRNGCRTRRAAAGASSTWRRGRRWNGAPAPA